MRYKILSHTADLRLEVYGKTLEELFMNAAEALTYILTGKKKPLLSYMIAVEKLEVRSVNLNSLLVDFLNEILAKSQIERRIYKVDKIVIASTQPLAASAAWREATQQSLEAEISGMPIEKFEEDVKAITYHEVDIKKEKEIWKTKLVFDI